MGKDLQRLLTVLLPAPPADAGADHGERQRILKLLGENLFAMEREAYSLLEDTKLLVRARAYQGRA